MREGCNKAKKQLIISGATRVKADNHPKVNVEEFKWDGSVKRAHYISGDVRIVKNKNIKIANNMVLA